MTSRTLDRTRVDLGAVLFVLLTIALGAFIGERVDWIRSRDYPPATDAYYYLQEIRSYAATGQGYYTEFSPFLWVLGLLRRYCFSSDRAVYDTAVLASLALMSLGLWMLRSPSRARWIALVPVVTLWASDLLFFRQYAFPAQATGLAACFLALALWVRSGTTGRVLALILLAFGAGTHTFAAGFSGVFLVGVAMRNPTWRRAALPLACLAALATAAWLSARPKTFLATSYSFRWPGLVEACRFANCSTPEWGEVGLFLAVVVGLVVDFAKRGSRDPLVGTLLLLVVILNAPVWTDEGHMSYRLALSSLWVLLLAVAIVRGPVLPPRLVSTFGVATVMVLGVAFWLPPRDYRGPDMSPALLLRNAEALRGFFSERDFVVAPHGVQFRLTYYFGVPAGRSLPERDEFERYFALRRAPRAGRFCRRPEESAELDAFREQQLTCLHLGEGWIVRRIPTPLNKTSVSKQNAAL